jgi:uridine kinase
VIGRIADHLSAQNPRHRLRVAVDGITAAGKTTLAGELATAVAARGRSAIHLTIDGFHHPRAHRYRQGRDSAVGYYQDAYDLESFGRLVLGPLGPEGDGRYRTRILDLGSDEPVDEPATQAPDDLVLIVDGSFLQGKSLRELWDDVVFADTSFEAARYRGARRDSAHFGGLAEAERAFEQRYHAACRIYLDDVDPRGSAGVVIGNDDVDNPVLERIGGPENGLVRLFSYGTLQQPEVQLSTFGRALEGTPDTLAGYERRWLTITDPDVIAASGSNRHPVVRALPAGTSPADPRHRDGVPGSVFSLTTTQLAAADRYEVDDYRRVRVRLGSGLTAWVYLAAG